VAVSNIGNVGIFDSTPFLSESATWLEIATRGKASKVWWLPGYRDQFRTFWLVKTWDGFK